MRAHRDLEIFSWSDRAGIGEQLISELGTQSGLSSANISEIIHIQSSTTVIAKGRLYLENMDYLIHFDICFSQKPT